MIILTPGVIFTVLCKKTKKVFSQKTYFLFLWVVVGLVMDQAPVQLETAVLTRFIGLYVVDDNRQSLLSNNNFTVTLNKAFICSPNASHILSDTHVEPVLSRLILMSVHYSFFSPVVSLYVRWRQRRERGYSRRSAQDRVRQCFKKGPHLSSQLLLTVKPIRPHASMRT